ncbi:MAG: helix-turn-helix transcriptional regulator [Akkermansia sp.]|nr:helix-turn-helix transcriptional regulator [Akkermansia sp.]
MQEKNALCEQFSTRFTEALASSGLRQKDLAEHTNIREQTLSRYKTGERIPDTYELYRIAVALGVSIDWLLGINSPADSATSPHSPTAREARLTEKLAIATAGLEAILAQLKKQ